MADFFEGDAGKERAELFVELYTEILSKTIVIQPLYGSCAVYLPPKLTIDLKKVVGESGYVHFAGHCVYLKEARYANEDSFLQSLDRHLERFCKADEEAIPFLVYSHEYWDVDDKRLDLARFRNGVHELKIFLDRAYIGNKRLVSLVGTLTDNYSGKLKVLVKGSFKVDLEFLQGRRHSLVLLRDYSVGDSLQRGDTVHYILYDQLFHNQNPTHIFEENKPGWSGPVTAPHTLFGAMLNLARPYLSLKPENNKINVCDPFVGSGTAACEAAKIPGVQFFGSDLSKLSSHLMNDNMQFFRLNSDQLGGWRAWLEQVPGTFLRLVNTGGAVTLASESGDNSFISRYVRSSDSDHLEIDEEELAKQFEETTIKERLNFYLHLRFLLRNEGGLLRGTRIDTMQNNGVSELLEQIKGLERLRRFRCGVDDKFLQEIPWTVSPAVVVSPKAFQRLRPVHSCMSVEKLPEGSFDIVITDPPYGYNTQENIEILARLYSVMIPRIVASLKPDGHLVMCLPERSYTGRRTFSFTHKDLVVRQVLLAAKKIGYEVLVDTAPTPVALYRPPYYWTSEKALSRSIVYFRFRKLVMPEAKKRTIKKTVRLRKAGKVSNSAGKGKDGMKKPRFRGRKSRSAEPEKS
jgi:16S rRNA G966 N2-methylase RsmD